MKKLLTLTLAVIFTMSALFAAYADEKIAVKTQDEIKVVVFKIGDSNYYLEDKDGNVQITKMDVAPYIKNGRTLVPARYLGNALGVPDENIIWNQTTKTAVFKGNKKLTLTIGSNTMKSNNDVIQMDATPEIIPPGRTMMLARYDAEGLGFEVGWDANRKLVICWEAGTPQPDLTEIIEEIEDNTPVVPKPGHKVLSSGELKKIYKIFENKGYKVTLR
ncbi:MAG: copper amine oxidase N-terminal domain-containing protein, partial [Syntrophomonadaceae bacterium]|nr:copper amine oxidase N-terminal domain-containing protein [Syntrophomonadaceae bacterium]